MKGADLEKEIIKEFEKADIAKSKNILTYAYQEVIKAKETLKDVEEEYERLKLLSIRELVNQFNTTASYKKMN